MALTRAQNLDLAIDQMAGLIVQVTATPGPDYTVDGQTVSKASYLRTLIEKLLELEQARQRADGAFEVRSRGV